MESERFIRQMEQSAALIARMVEDISNEAARWKPAPDKWSTLEVINHLYDEEREDFRPRLDIMLHRPEESFVPWDPERVVIERRYNERDLRESVEHFLAEREQSLRWLRALEKPDWDRRYQSPKFTMRAGDMFASWVLHDLLHVRQLTSLQVAYTTMLLEPYDTAYATPAITPKPLDPNS